MSEASSDHDPAPGASNGSHASHAGGRRRPPWLTRGGPVSVIVLVLLTYAVLGAVAGAVWELVWTPPTQVITQHQVYADSYASLRGVFTGTALYVVVGAVTSALAALAVTMIVRGRELLVLLLVLLGSALAAAIMHRVGMSLGPPDPATIAAHTAGRATVQGKLDVQGRSPYVMWPVASLVVLALVYFALPGRAAPARRHRDVTPADPREAGPREARHR